jgi:hypothetical protein
MSGTNSQLLYLLTNQSDGAICFGWAVSGGPKTKVCISEGVFLDAEGVLFRGEGRGGVAEDGGRFGGSRGVIEGLGRTVEGLLSNWQKVIGSE